MKKRLRWQGTRALLGLCVGIAIGWVVSATARDARGAPAAPGGTHAIGATWTAVCALGRACTGTAGCAGDCDPDSSLISGCARCEKGVYAGCSQGMCQDTMELTAAASAGEQLCPNQLMTPCAAIGEMCTIGHTAHRCRCSTVGGWYLKWICK